MNNTDVEAPNPGIEPKLGINCKRVAQIWLVNQNVVPGSTKNTEVGSSSWDRAFKEQSSAGCVLSLQPVPGWRMARSTPPCGWYPSVELDLHV